ncbi:hypothetical protein B0A52_00629 [Exophiala mesophila]|uniref:Prenyltransferase alpha-alpha toroid domain-containing protein n=1 Tax=Exophiala mesophila TaxID=212818 RepID=A0A438NHS5_EXOME|nr:hypothetical protein B0A52_00629 [Exophiala mesophila]
MPSHDPQSSIPLYFREPPILVDSLETTTSKLQDETVSDCLPFLEAAETADDPAEFNSFGLLSLHREDHVQFLHENLAQFPANFVGLDASRPWMVYWALAALYMLGEDITPLRSRVVKTFYPGQNKSGGFGGGHGHSSHLAGSYATILSLAIVGGEEAYSLVDREAMWRWLGRLKQPDGGFRISEGGEEDTRGAYCALVIISLLALPISLPLESPARSAGLETFFDGLGEYISRCQTYEGGIGGSPGNEAHGAYAFCAIACLCLLDAPHKSLNKYLDLDALVWWLSARQYAPEGGLAGRTNKVVDGVVEHHHSYSVADETTPFESAWSWVSRKAQVPSEAHPTKTFDTGAHLQSLHPVYVIPHQAVYDMRDWSSRNPVNLA